jgi:purine-nucleoside/S-methyl-5'-thioadenosine phosphorylase / adenosine deaminase
VRGARPGRYRTGPALASATMLTHAPWRRLAGFHHGFFDGRESTGGVEAVLSAHGIPGALVVPRQVHGTRVADAAPGESPVADALVTTTGRPLAGIVTADCMPVLLLAPGRGVAVAVHAGWRGCAGGVLEAALACLRDAYGAAPREIEAVIGPAIGGCCYEVGDDVVEAFRRRTGATTSSAWTVRGGRDHLDLRMAARLLLGAAGVPLITVLGPCSACSPAYHSYRRDGARVGRQISFVGWA